jgi:hypothetical protein
MTAIWPDALPRRFTVSSYQETRPDNVLYSEVSVGPAKARRRTTSNVWDQSGTMVMTYDQYRSFLRFLSSASCRPTSAMAQRRFGSQIALVVLTCLFVSRRHPRRRSMRTFGKYPLR